MPKLIDLTGKKFNRWTVLKKADSKNGSVYWVCQCECGTVKEVRGQHLKSGASKSCGCLQTEKAKETMKKIGKISKENKLIDLTGQKFGKWTVISRGENTKNGSARWNCKCECGNEGLVRGSALRSGKSKSCGKCTTFIDSLTFDNLTGRKFGKLTALELLQEKSKNGSRLWLCKCDCGNFKKVSRNSLLNGNTKSCGCLASYGEPLIEKLLKENNIEYEKQKTFSSCTFSDTNKLVFFDFYIPKQNYLIEFDGIQHYQTKNKGWDTEDKLLKTQEHDKIKNQWCKENNMPLIRIPYTHLDNLCIEDLMLDTSKFII